jgi:hypothetical protein
MDIISLPTLIYKAIAYFWIAAELLMKTLLKHAFCIKPLLHKKPIYLEFAPLTALNMLFTLMSQCMKCLVHVYKAFHHLHISQILSNNNSVVLFKY